RDRRQYRGLSAADEADRHRAAAERCDRRPRKADRALARLLSTVPAPHRTAMLYYEDIEVGAVERFGRKQVTREEVIDFASQFDPQPFHLDDEAAAATHFGRLSASGWHTGAMTMRMLVDHMRARAQAGLGSPGIDELR